MTYYKPISDPSIAAGGTFVHPSLFFMDHKIAEMIHVINLFPDVQLLRGEELFIQQGDRIFWKINKEIQLNREAERPRILVCGQTGAGKSALINKVFGQEKVARSLIEYIAAPSRLSDY